MRNKELPSTTHFNRGDYRKPVVTGGSHSAPSPLCSESISPHSVSQKRWGFLVVDPRLQETPVFTMIMVPSGGQSMFVDLISLDSFWIYMIMPVKSREMKDTPKVTELLGCRMGPLPSDPLCTLPFGLYHCASKYLRKGKKVEIMVAFFFNLHLKSS
jgi:hypothetical protein